MKAPFFSDFRIKALALLVVFLIGVVLLQYASGIPQGQILKDILNIVGGLLSVSVVTTVIYDSIVKAADDAARKKELSELLDNKLDNILGQAITHGFQGVCNEVDIQGLLKGLKAGDTLWWLNTYIATHKHWHDELQQALAKGAKVNMMVLSPNTEIAKLRAEELTNYTENTFNDELRTYRHDMDLISGKYPEQFEIREYENLPGCPLFIVTREKEKNFAYSGFYLEQPTGTKCPHLYWEESAASPMLNIFLTYVENKWGKSAKLTLT